MDEFVIKEQHRCEMLIRLPAFVKHDLKESIEVLKAENLESPHRS